MTKTTKDKDIEKVELSVTEFLSDKFADFIKSRIGVTYDQIKKMLTADGMTIAQATDMLIEKKNVYCNTVMPCGRGAAVILTIQLSSAYQRGESQ